MPFLARELKPRCLRWLLLEIGSCCGRNREREREKPKKGQEKRAKRNGENGNKGKKLKSQQEEEAIMNYVS